MMGDDRSGSVSPSPPCLQLPGDREEDKQRDVRELILRISKVDGHWSQCCKCPVSPFHDQFLRELSTEATHRDTQNLNFVRRRSLQTVAELGDLRDTLVR